MGLHHESNHGRVFRGLEALQHLESRKRDSHGSRLKWNVPDKAADADAGGVTTSAASTAAATSAASSTINSDEEAYLSAKAGATNRGHATSAAGATTSAVVASPTSTVDDGSNNKSLFLNPPETARATASATPTPTPTADASSSATNAANAVAGTPISATNASNGIGQTHSGMSGGAKAGVAIGVLLAVALAAGLLFFCWRRKKNPNAHQEAINEKHVSSSSSFFGGKAMSEKHASVASDSSSARAASTAPRLSLRPVTQFLPNLADNHKNTGHTVDGAAAASEKPKSMWERRANASENPFADAAVLSEKQARPVSPPSNPFDEPEGKAAAAAADEKASVKSGHSQQSSWEGTEPPTPSSLKFGTAAAVPVAAAGSATAPKAGPNNVHRVQLDFKPSMDDELELKSGQLVRVLHEYDDGWALCIRMDRSQQGVAPRTCLSKLPVKPRPQGPPPNGANGRPMTPTGPPGMMPRPLTPTGRERAGSAAGAERPQTPTGAVPARKPVPGQAL